MENPLPKDGKKCFISISTLITNEFKDEYDVIDRDIALVAFKGLMYSEVYTNVRIVRIT
jgi:hypothetical protein